MSCELQGKNEQADDNYKLQTTNGNIETHPFLPFIPKGIKYLSLLNTIILQLEETGLVAAKNKPHKLTGNYNGFKECHIQPDWLLVWF